MASPFRFPTCLRIAVLALATTTVFAAGPRVHFHGHAMRGLPRGHAVYHYRGAPYYFHRGFWYEPWRGGFRGIYPPIGLSLAFLPEGYASFWFGGVPYYSYEDVYYTDAPSGGYIVADPPPETGRIESSAPISPKAGSPDVGHVDAAALDALLIIPKKGQSEDQMVTDRKEAQRYALGKSGYDPNHSDPQDPGTPRARQAYLRDMRSYLEERGYSVK